MELIIAVAIIAWLAGIVIMNREAKNKVDAEPSQACELKREDWWRLNGYDKNFKK